ncbi:MAG: nucleoside hydrolase [Candidatus Latescibacteria bacterium]|nr:nucleoside hydrolase [Candidatus Latescibacterota bacterium]
MAPIPIVFDTDPGVDDALALMLALASPELDVMGVCTVNGNVSLDICTRNALGLLQLLERNDVPVYRGADQPLVREPVYATEVHGKEGMGAAVLPVSHVAAKENAAAFLVEQLTQRPEEVTVIAVGPLTNLALAEKIMPGVLAKAKRVVAMGGAVVAPGNASATAEFNFYADPHAAQDVIRSGAKLTLVPLDATQQVGLAEAVIREKIVPLDTPMAKFVVDAVANVLAYGEQLGRDTVVYLHDPLAVGVAIAPSMFDCLQFSLDVETVGDLTMGQLVSDRRQAPVGGRLGHTVNCVMGVQADRFLNLFLERTLNLQAE